MMVPLMLFLVFSWLARHFHALQTSTIGVSSHLDLGRTFTDLQTFLLGQIA